MSRKKQQLTAALYERYQNMWLIRIMRLAESAIQWKGFPNTVDTIYMENVLNRTGSAIVVREEMLSEKPIILCGQNASVGQLDIYGVPMDRRVIFRNGTPADYSIDDSVIIYNNSMRMADLWIFEMLASEMADIDMAIRVNVQSQKTMPIFPASQPQKLSIEQMYSSIENNIPYITIDPQSINLDQFKNALMFDNRKSFTSDLMIQVQKEKWNRILTFLGINNVNIEKKERVNVQEVMSNNDELLVMRRDRLNSRERAAKLLSEKFGTKIEVSYYAEENINGNVYNNGINDMSRSMATRSQGTGASRNRSSDTGNVE